MTPPPPPPDATAPEVGARFEPAVPAADVQPRSGNELEDEPYSEDAPLAPLRWRTNILLFIATVFSTFLTGALYRVFDPTLDFTGNVVAALLRIHLGWTYAVPLLAILLTHEFGHFFAARLHRVDASLPYFIPLPPILSPFGTMGAVIAMRGRIRSRNALLDIGASGPLAGLLIAIPVLLVGLAGSKVAAMESPGTQEGQSLLYFALKRIVLGPIPDGHDVYLNPVAFAGWTGLFLTALNLIPIGQLDGGHIAYALFGPRQNRYARLIHQGLLVMFAYNLIRFMFPVLRDRAWGDVPQALGNSAVWLVWFGLLHLVKRISGEDHPPTEPGELSPARRAVAVLSLVLFVLLFMPTPWSTH
jgi:membrane-associated protease RseP (regulator of RpoE activity)